MVLNPRVHVSNEDNLKGYVGQFHLVNYYIRNPTLFPEFYLKKFEKDKRGSDQDLATIKTAVSIRDYQSPALTIFGTSPKRSKCVRLLLLWTHTCGIWLDQKITIDANSIHVITGLPWDG